VNLFCDEKLVGTLRLSGAAWRVEFSSTATAPLSPHFACQNGNAFETQSVQDFFVNYLPEEPFAARVAARIKPSPKSFEDWFTALGQELTGAYALAPLGASLECSEYVDLPNSVLIDGMQSSRHRADAIAFGLNSNQSLPRLSLAGAQDKFALWFDPTMVNADQRFKIPKGRAASTHIFKPASTDSRYPMLPANEYACMQLAHAIGLPVPHSDVITIGGVRTLVTKRFDREVIDKSVRRIHQIDLCQLLCLPRERKYASHNDGVDTEQFFAACNLLAVPALARRMHLRAWLFNFLIGNQDAHAKNYSFLYQRGWQAAPLYDLLCVLPYLPDQTLSMGLLNEYRAGWFEGEHWLNLASVAGVPSAYLAKEIRTMLDAVQAALTPLANQLRARLLDEELEFLATRINPIIQERVSYLRRAASILAPSY
jgi:serine/threonine-protein kinase HipA